MLGLDVSRLAVPDYEVVTRLERLIQNHHATNAGLHPGFLADFAEKMAFSNFLKNLEFIFFKLEIEKRLRNYF